MKFDDKAMRHLDHATKELLSGRLSKAAKREARHEGRRIYEKFGQYMKDTNNDVVKKRRANHG